MLPSGQPSPGAELPPPQSRLSLSAADGEVDTAADPGLSPTTTVQLDPYDVLQQDRRYEERLVVALLERSRHALNNVLYRPSKDVAPTASTEGLNMPPGIDPHSSFLEHFLRETEKVCSAMGRYSRPEQFSYSTDLPPPVLPLQKQPLVLRANSVNMNDRIKCVYEVELMRVICARSPDTGITPLLEDTSLGRSLQCDIECLQALSNYIHHSKFDAEVKFQTQSSQYAELIERQDADSIRAQLENDEDGTKVLQRVYARAQQYGGSGKSHYLGGTTERVKSEDSEAPGSHIAEAAFLQAARATDGVIGSTGIATTAGAGAVRATIAGLAPADLAELNAVITGGALSPRTDVFRGVEAAATAAAADAATAAAGMATGSSGGVAPNLGRTASATTIGTESTEAIKQRQGPSHRICRIFREHILQLRLECQVGYLLERVRGLQVAYLGPSGTYSHHAVLSYFGPSVEAMGHSVGDGVDGVQDDLFVRRPTDNVEVTAQQQQQERNLHQHLQHPLELPQHTGQQGQGQGQGRRFQAIACRNVESIFSMVVANQAQFGVVPIENSHTGISSTTRDLLVQGALNVTGEIYIPVRHHLLSKCQHLKMIKRVYSHNQSFEQCQAWLAANCPNAEQIAGLHVADAVASTAKGAMLASQQPDTAAAICSDLGSRVSKIPVIAKNIMSSATNATRFLVVGHHRSERSGSDNTLMTICIRHEPGSLSQALGVLSKHGNNICAVESFPDRESLRRCFVWIECEGHIKDPSMIQAVAELAHYTTSVRILGSFPRHSVRHFITARTLNPMPASSPGSHHGQSEMRGGRVAARVRGMPEPPAPPPLVSSSTPTPGGGDNAGNDSKRQRHA